MDIIRLIWWLKKKKKYIYLYRIFKKKIICDSIPNTIFLIPPFRIDTDYSRTVSLTNPTSVNQFINFHTHLTEQVESRRIGQLWIPQAKRGRIHNSQTDRDGTQRSVCVKIYEFFTWGGLRQSHSSLYPFWNISLKLKKFHLNPPFYFHTYLYIIN